MVFASCSVSGASERPTVLCRRSSGPGLVVEPCCPGILVADYCLLPALIGHGDVIAGGWGWYAELCGDLRPRHARRRRVAGEIDGILDRAIPPSRCISAIPTGEACGAAASANASSEYHRLVRC
ncbi:hypothetical protein ACFVKB_16935 [Rhodococcus sp. NPDC127530]|uniref:hypothetical protein n=1 Tax=unclassified Rhodococcus (in: high G+C Gram-positive bacteria) TaxID=192944 RepID=UPI00362E7848